MKVEYLIACPHCIDQFEPVCKELVVLGVDAYFVVPYFIPTVEACLNLLIARNLPFKTKIDPHADVAITIANHMFLYEYKNLKIKFKYGVNISRDASNTSKTQVIGFDGILTHGYYEKNLIEKLQVIPSERICIMGYPKHDYFFCKKESVEQIKKRLHIAVPSHKNIITYFPTWGRKSSIDLFYESFLELKNEYYIITKPHHNNFYLPEKAMRWKKLERISDNLLSVHVPFADAAAVADIIVADGKSGSLAEAMLINPKAPLIGLHVTKISPKNNYYSSALDACEFVNNPEDLHSTVYRVIKNDHRQEARKLFVQNIFSYVGEQCAKRAASQIIKLSKVKKISAKPSPLWFRQSKRLIKKSIKTVCFIELFRSLVRGR